jgi:hypothetical protein
MNLYCNELYKCKQKGNHVAFSPQAKYTDGAAAACRRSQYHILL